MWFFVVCLFILDRINCKGLSHCNDELIKPGSADDTGEPPAYEVKLIEEASLTGAACLDGSPPAYYFRANNDTNIKKYFIYLAGGAWCSGISRHIACGWDDCYSRSKKPTGSTTFDEPYMQLPSNSRQYFSMNADINPLLYNWNFIYVIYCDGSSFSSNLTDPIIYDDTPLYFRGIRNLEAVLKHALLYQGMNEATDIILGGCSSGALGVYLHVDHVNEYIKLYHNSNEYNYMGYGDSGFFYNYESNGNFSDAMKYLYYSQNISGLNKDCLAQYNNASYQYNCIYAQNVSPFIKSKMFATQSQYDDWQIYCDLNNNNNITIINEYGYNISSSFISNFTDNNSLHSGVISSCRYHCGWHSVLNITMGNQMNNFYNNNLTNNLLFGNITYPCNNCC